MKACHAIKLLGMKAGRAIGTQDSENPSDNPRMRKDVFTWVLICENLESGFHLYLCCKTEIKPSLISLLGLEEQQNQGESRFSPYCLLRNEFRLGLSRAPRAGNGFHLGLSHVPGAGNGFRLGLHRAPRAGNEFHLGLHRTH